MASVAVFLLFLVRPAAIVFLRHRAAAKDPAAWAALSSNGQFRLPLAQLFPTRYYDENLYALLVHQVVLHGLPYDPYWRENRTFSGWIFHDPISMEMLAAIAWLCGKDMTLAWIMAVAVLGTAWFLLFYEIFRWWSGGRDRVAIPLALFSIFFPDVYLYLLDLNFHPDVIRARFFSIFFQPAGVIRPSFYRLPAPLLTYLLWSLCLLAAWGLARRKQRGPLPAALAGAAFGLLALVHSPEWAFGMATLGIFAAMVWLLEANAAARWNLAIAVASGAVVSAIWAALPAFAIPLKTRQDMFYLVGVVHSRRFLLVALVHVLAAVFAIAQGKNEDRTDRRLAWLLLASGEIAAFAARECQVLTGFTIQPFHFIPLGSFLGCLMALLWASDALSRNRLWTENAAMAATGLLLLCALANEVAAARGTYRLFGLPRDVDAALAWTRDHIPADGLVLSLSMETNETVPLYTGAMVQAEPLDPHIAGPLSFERYLYKVGQLLKSSRADVGRFMDERWLLPMAEIGELSDTLSAAFRQDRVDISAAEPAGWDNSFLSSNAEKAGQYRDRLRELATQAPGLQPPYYLWINADDAPFLPEPPEKFGGKLLYRNPTVRIYGFFAAEKPDRQAGRS